MTYEECEDKCDFIASELVRVYFLGIDRKKVSPEETLEMCPKFIKDTWGVLNMIRTSDE